MKFRRGINLALKDNRNIVVPRGELWRYSISSGDRDGDFGALADSDASGKGIYTQVYSTADAKLKSTVSIYITGVTFAAG